MIEKNQSVVGKVTALGTNGEGIIRHEGTTFFVPACLPEEEVRFKVLKIKNGIGYGKIEEILSPSFSRVSPRCPHFLKCGGCDLQHLSYAGQLAFKRGLVQDALKKIGGIETAVGDTVPCEKEYAYRNKLQLPVSVDKDGQTVVGFYATRSHRIVPLERCDIHPSWAETLISVFKEYVKKSGVKGYDEEKKTGDVRHLIAREIGGKFIFTVVGRGKKLPSAQVLVDGLQGAFHDFTLYYNRNEKETNVILGKEFTLVHGSGFFEATEGGITYEAGPATFLQVNETVRAKLYEAAVSSVVEEGDEVVIDAYSGGGLMTAMIAKKAKQVFGIELEAEAVRCANALKEKNGSQNMQNICGYVEEEIQAVLQKVKGGKTRLIVDPPRAGVHKNALQAIAASGVEKITYVSCNPATLARDLGILTGSLAERDGVLVKADEAQGAYEIVSVTPYDMFPQTKHVETLVCLSRKETVIGCFTRL
ncbi:MAG: 23S rRNA (uracil(1939)-C(5))-methyltransferase RlmD [Clostridia bacterium]|nr:23S rRNA (uracil(1939)-C(5))-methyltransferase RlmD [Clostridia bacterium]